MNGIIGYLDSTIEDVEKTIENSKKYGLNEDRIPEWESFLTVLRERDINKIIPLVEENIGFFYTTPMGETFFRNGIEKSLLYAQLEKKNYRYGGLHQVSFEEMLSDDVIRSWFENLSQAEYDEFVGIKIYYLEKETKEFIDYLLDRYSDKHGLLGLLYMDSVKEYVTRNREMVQLLISEKGFSIINFETEDYENLWRNFPDLITNLSQSEKMEFFKKIMGSDSALVSDVFEKLKLLDNIELLGVDFKKILPYCSEETKKE